MDYAMTLENVNKSYKDFALKNVNISLERGTIMGFIGENGAGKSTTINMILNLIAKDSGKITLLGQDYSANPRLLHEKIGVVIDEAGFSELLNVSDVGKISAHIFKTWDEKKFKSLCGRFALPEKKTIKEYSKGMKTKLMIAAAMSHASEILILDEATSGLDPIVRDEVLDIFLEYIECENCAIFMSSHIISDLEKICDYITFIHKGEIIFSEQKDVLCESYAILKCSEEELAKLDKSKLYGQRKNRFGVEALVKRDELQCKGLTLDRASIEDIMLYTVKEN